jgi:hypothetical protein
MAKMTLDKKKKVLMNIYDAQINRQLKNIRKGGYNESKALKDVSKMQQVMKKYNK